MATDDIVRIDSYFPRDYVEVFDGIGLVFLDVYDGVTTDDDEVTFAGIHLKPKQARKLAKALKKAARKAEG